jgi:hypothetical protein
MSVENRIAFVKKVLEVSQRGEVKWERHSSNAFRALIGSYTVLVIEETGMVDLDQAPDYSIVIRSKEETLDIMEPGEIAKPGFNGYNALREIYQCARRSALGADRAIAEMLKKLNEV